jgi:ribosomal protein L15
VSTPQRLSQDQRFAGHSPLWRITGKSGFKQVQRAARVQAREVERRMSCKANARST